MGTPSLPNVLVLTEECISTAHGTGTTLIRHFRNYPQEKLLNIYWMPKGEPVFKNHVYAQYHWAGGQPSKTSYDFSVVRFPNNVRQLIEETGFVPDVIYSTFFGWFGLKLLDLILKDYNYAIPVIQHFHDLQMPFNDLGPLEPELQAIAPHLTEIWALTPSIADDVSFITGRTVQVVNTFCDVVPSIYKQEHREFSSDFTAVITGNIWINDIINDLKSAWRWVGEQTGGIRPIQWYCHKENMRENLEKHVFSDRKPVIEYVGFVRGDDLYRVLSESDIAIIPFNRTADPENNYARYSLPSRLTETVLAGVPSFVAAGSRTVTAQYVQEKGIGIAATASDPEHFRQTLLMFAQNRNVREQCGNHARAMGLTEYNIERYEKFFYGKLHEVALQTKQIQVTQSVVPHTQPSALLVTTLSVTILVCTPDRNSPITQRCIDSISRYTSPPYELLVFENDKAGSFKHAREINRALDIARGDVLVTLDDDVEVTPGWLEAMLALAKPDVGIVGCVHYEGRENSKKTNVIDHAGGIVAIDGSTSHYRETLIKPVTAPFACSACILINDKSLRFDLDYNKYYQDVDFSLQAWETGKKVVISPHAIYHYVSGQMEALGYNYERKLRILADDFEIFREKWIYSSRLVRLEATIHDQLDINFSHHSFGSAAISAAAAQLPVTQDTNALSSSLSTQNGQSRMPNNPQQLLLQRIRQTQDALNNWNYLRMRQDETVRQSKILSRIRPLGFIYILLARFRKLGKVWAAEGRLYEALLRLQSDTVETLLTATSYQQDSTLEPTTQFNEMTRSFSKQQEQIIWQLETILAQQNDLQQTLSSLSARVEQIESAAQQTLSSLSARVEQIESAAAQQSDLQQTVAHLVTRIEGLEGLDERVRLSISHIRMMQQNAAHNIPNNFPAQLRGNGIIEVLRRLEDKVQELKQATQVDVTIQSSGMEEEIAQLVARLNGRHCVMTPQLWYYIDFTPNWDHPALFRSAQNKVQAGGRFVVITSKEHEAHKQDSGLTFEGTQDLPDFNVTAYIWRNE